MVSSVPGAFGGSVKRSAIYPTIGWFFFFIIAEMLVKLPASFHEGTLWQAKEGEDG